MLQREKGVVSPAPSTLVSDLVVLFKVRIVVLLLLAAMGGLFVGAHGWPGGGPLALTLVTGASSGDGQLGVEPVPGA